MTSLSPVCTIFPEEGLFVTTSVLRSECSILNSEFGIFTTKNATICRIVVFSVAFYSKSLLPREQSSCRQGLQTVQQQRSDNGAFRYHSFC